MMEPSDGSPPNSMYMVRCGEMFPKPVMEKEDDKLQIPFKECKYSSYSIFTVTSANCILWLSSARRGS